MAEYGIGQGLLQLAQFLQNRNERNDRLREQAINQQDKEKQYQLMLQEFLANKNFQEQSQGREDLRMKSEAAGVESQNFGPGQQVSPDVVSRAQGTPYASRYQTSLPARFLELPGPGEQPTPAQPLAGTAEAPLQGGPTFGKSVPAVPIRRPTAAEDLQQQAQSTANQVQEKYDRALAALSPADRNNVILGAKPGQLSDADRTALEHKYKLEEMGVELKNRLQEIAAGKNKGPDTDYLKLMLQVHLEGKPGRDATEEQIKAYAEEGQQLMKLIGQLDPRLGKFLSDVPDNNPAPPKEPDMFAAPKPADSGPSFMDRFLSMFSKGPGPVPVPGQEVPLAAPPAGPSRLGEFLRTGPQSGVDYPPVAAPPPPSPATAFRPNNPALSELMRRWLATHKPNSGVDYPSSR